MRQSLRRLLVSMLQHSMPHSAMRVHLHTPGDGRMIYENRIIRMFDWIHTQKTIALTKLLTCRIYREQLPVVPGDCMIMKTSVSRTWIATFKHVFSVTPTINKIEIVCSAQSAITIDFVHLVLFPLRNFDYLNTLFYVIYHPYASHHFCQMIISNSFMSWL